MTSNQKITLNVVANLVSFAITIIISLFITPVVVNALGSEAYGFVGLANNFVSYATLVTVALNSMASRFVSIEIYKGDFREANKYFSSVFFANLLLVLVMAPVLAGIVWQLEHVIEIPESLLADVKIAFGITFIQFLLNILLARYEIATFVTNRLYLNQKNNLIASFLRLALTLLCFSLLSVRVTYLVAATFVGTVFCSFMNMVYTRRYLPELKLRRTDFSFAYIKRLLASGVWNLVNKLSSVLLDGLDLLISNLFIGPAEMGALAISKTVPAMFVSLRGSLDYPFTPPMTQCYANGDIEGVIRNARMGNKVLGILMIAPMATFAVYGQSFFRLWVPGEDSAMIQGLSLLAILNLLAGACINSVFSIFTVANKVKVPSMVLLATGVLTVITNFILLKTTNWGVYIIAGVSSVYSLLRNFIFTPLYGAYCLKVKKSTFYHEIITGNICLAINLVVGFLIYRFVCDGSSWIELILSAGCMAVICIAVNFFIVLSKNERATVYDVVKKKLKRG